MHKINRASHLTTEQRESLAMFLLTLTETHSEAFLAAANLLSNTKIAVAGVAAFMDHHYLHLPDTAKLYVIAAMIDYQLIRLSSQHCRPSPEEFSALECVCFQLSEFYHREHLWANKLRGITPYHIFNLLDKAKLGYVTRKHLSAFIKQTLHISPKEKQSVPAKSKRLSDLKLAGNNGGSHKGACRIYLENMVECLGRVTHYGRAAVNASPNSTYQAILDILAQRKKQKEQIERNRSAHHLNKRLNQLSIERCAYQNSVIKDYAKRMSQRSERALSHDISFGQQMYSTLKKEPERRDYKRSKEQGGKNKVSHELAPFKSERELTESERELAERERELGESETVATTERKKYSVKEEATYATTEAKPLCDVDTQRARLEKVLKKQAIVERISLELRCIQREKVSNSIKGVDFI